MIRAESSDAAGGRTGAARRRADTTYRLSPVDAVAQETHFGVARDQIELDFVISHVLAVLAGLRDRFIFYGGTALSRTILDGLRLSEDIDMLSVGPRADVARAVDDALSQRLERGFGALRADPWLAQVASDTDACVVRIGTVQLKLQLLDGRDYPEWPRHLSDVNLRYSGLGRVQLSTYTPAGFVCAKTSAWMDSSRNAPRDLYDLWALGARGDITADAAALFRRLGPTGGYPRPSTLPKTAPTRSEWHDSLGRQCIPRVGPSEAHEAVLAAWENAVVEDEERSRSH